MHVLLSRSPKTCPRCWLGWLSPAVTKTFPANTRGVEAAPEEAIELLPPCIRRIFSTFVAMPLGPKSIVLARSRSVLFIRTNRGLRCQEHAPSPKYLL